MHIFYTTVPQRFHFTPLTKFDTKSIGDGSRYTSQVTKCNERRVGIRNEDHKHSVALKRDFYCQWA